MIIKDFEKYDVGVIIGRFQVHDLHEAHKTLISTVSARHKKVILFLGVSPVLGSRKNPLDFTARKLMIQEYYPDMTILALPDKRSDEEWSKNLDARIREIFKMGKILIYGGRDSFFDHYTGSFDICELEQSIYVSGTAVRKEASEEIKGSKLWRAGVIYQAYNRYPVSFQTVDIAAFSSDEKNILLAKKPGENLYRFIGGFVDTTDVSLEHTAKREFAEEAGGAEAGNFNYIGSFRVDDWRYQSDIDKIMTVLFKANYLFGCLSPSDDIEELRWFSVDEFVSHEFVTTKMMSEHRILATTLIASLATKQ